MRTKSYAVQAANLPPARVRCESGHALYRYQSFLCDGEVEHRAYRCPMRLGAGACNSRAVVMPPLGSCCEKRQQGDGEVRR